MNGNPNQAGITILMTDRSCLQGKYKRKPLHANKGNSSLKDRTIVNIYIYIYVSNIVAPDLIK